MDLLTQSQEFPTLEEAQNSNSSIDLATKDSCNQEKVIIRKKDEAKRSSGKKLISSNENNGKEITLENSSIVDPSCSPEQNNKQLVDDQMCNIQHNRNEVKSSHSKNCVLTTEMEQNAPLQTTILAKSTRINESMSIREKKDQCNENTCDDLPPEVRNEYIRKLKLRNPAWPHAKYYCGMCNYHMNNLALVHKHRKDGRHMSLLEACDLLDTIRFLPKPTNGHIGAITSCLNNLLKRIQLPAHNFSQRQKIVSKLNTKLQATFPDWNIKLELYGSSLSGFALINSDVNISFTSDLPPNNLYLSFSEILKFLDSSPDYACVSIERCNNMPVVCFEDVESKFLCRIAAFSQDCVKTAYLIQACIECEPRLLTIGLVFRYWAKLCNLDNEKFGHINPVCFILMAVYYFQNQKLLPVFQISPTEENSLGSSDSPHGTSESSVSSSTCNPDDLPKLRILLADWKADNNDSVGKLWLGMLRFYGIHFKHKKCVVSLRNDKLTKVSKGWNSKKFAVEEPFILKKNLAGGISNSSVVDHFLLTIKYTYKYFATPQLEDGPLFEFLDVKRAGNPNKKLIPRNIDDEDDDDDDEDKDDEDDEDDMESDDIVTTLSSQLDNSSLDEQCEMLDSKLALLSSEARKRLATDVAYRLYRLISPSDLTYKFESYPFTLGKLPPIMCAICQKKGHLKDQCSELLMPAVLPKHELSKRFKTLISKVCNEVYREWVPTDHESNVSRNFFKQIEEQVLLYNSDALLVQFGSLMNGFGLKSSDIDICMTFRDNKSGDQIDQVKIVDELARHLKRSPHFSCVIPIMSAKVPIVKFCDKHGVLEGDISLYNLLALHNTRMLKLYSNIDERVKILGYVIKIFAKVCQIGDASKGSLSSYAYILMLIYYLQQRTPPVLPVLQELYDKTLPKPERIVNGANVWFWDDLDDLERFWPDYGKNKETIGELWLGLLKFYSNEFSFDEHVISIRQYSLLTKMEKLWCGKTVAIEDPFDLNHNLGSGLSTKMYVYIRKAFIRTYNHFSTPLDHLDGYRSAVEYFFDRNRITDGPPPNDRGCRRCGAYNHMVKACPFNKEQRSRKNLDHLFDWPRKHDTNAPANVCQIPQNMMPVYLPVYPQNQNYLMYYPNSLNTRSAVGTNSGSSQSIGSNKPGHIEPPIKHTGKSQCNELIKSESKLPQPQANSVDLTPSKPARLFQDIEAEVLKAACSAPSGALVSSLPAENQPNKSPVVSNEKPIRDLFPVNTNSATLVLPFSGLESQSALSYANVCRPAANVPPSYANVCRPPPGFHVPINRPPPQDASAYSVVGAPLYQRPSQQPVFSHQYSYQLSRPAVPYNYPQNAQNKGPGLLGNHPPMYMMWPQQQLGYTNPVYANNKELVQSRKARDILADMALPVIQGSKNQPSK